MQDDKTIMKFENTLPEDFDGVFRFTNWSEEDFVAKWGGKEYHYPALTTSPMIIPEHSPLEVQFIRKKFAKDLAEREFFKSDQYRSFKRQEVNDDGTPKLNSIHMAGTYSIETLTPFIQKALVPLPEARAKVKPMEKENIEDKLSKDEDGNTVTEAVDRKTSLRDKALKAGQ